MQLNLNKMNLKDTHAGVGSTAFQLYDKSTIPGKYHDEENHAARYLPVFFSQCRRVSDLPMFSDSIVRIPEPFPAGRFEGWPLQIGSVYAR
jgi:hypothetical protein